MEQFNRDVDNLPHGPEWHRQTIQVDGDQGSEILDLWLRDIVEVVRELIKDRRFLEYMRFAPERHWETAEKKIRIYDEMWSGDWWWRIQVGQAHISNEFLLNIEGIERTWKGRNGCSVNPRIRQNSNDYPEREQACLASVPDNRKYQQGCPPSAKSTCHGTRWILASQRTLVLLKRD